MSPIRAIFALLCLYYSLPSTYSQGYCNYHYDYTCANYTSTVKDCSPKHVPRASELHYSVIQDPSVDDYKSVVVVEFPTPDENCIYEVQLYVAPGINSWEDCMNHTFNMRDDRVHTSHKYVCPENNQRSNLTGNASCEREIAEVWYDHVYTGCYSFAFIADNFYVFLKNAFLETTYKKTEIETPLIDCFVTGEQNQTDKESENVDITAFINVKYGSPRATLSIGEASSDNTCNGNHLLKEDHNLLSVPFVIDQSCSLEMRTLRNGTRFQQMHCRFPVENAPKTSNYCFYMSLSDIRCSSGTIWRPSSGNAMFPCNWSLKCPRKTFNATTSTKDYPNNMWRQLAETLHLDWPFTHKNGSEIGNVKVEKTESPNTGAYIATVIVLALIGSITLFCLLVAAVIYLYRRYSRRKFRHDAADVEQAAGDDIEMNEQSQGLVGKQSREIMLMYVKDEPNFMRKMLDLERELEDRTGCKAYSWWTPNVCSEVTAQGGYSWASDNILRGCRVVWIDTPKARRLLAEVKHGSAEYGDFRDNNFMGVLDLVRRSKNPDTEYLDLLVVRFTDKQYEVPDSSDPFSDIAANCRYWLYEGLDDIVKHLSD